MEAVSLREKVSYPFCATYLRLLKFPSRVRTNAVRRPSAAVGYGLAKSVVRAAWAHSMIVKLNSI